MFFNGEWRIPIKNINNKGLTLPSFWSREGVIELFRNNNNENVYLLKMLYGPTLKYEYHLIFSKNIKKDKQIIYNKYTEYLSEFHQIKTMDDIKLTLFTIEHLLW